VFGIHLELRVLRASPRMFPRFLYSLFASWRRWFESTLHVLTEVGVGCNILLQYFFSYLYREPQCLSRNALHQVFNRVYDVHFTLLLSHNTFRCAERLSTQHNLSATPLGLLMSLEELFAWTFQAKFASLLLMLLLS
jgi:hypothetical protein